MWGRVTIFLTRLQGNQEIWRVNVWRLKCVISKYHEIHLQCTILTIKVVYLFWCFWCFGGLCEEHSPPGPGLPVSLALGQHHGILCQAVGVHAVWICLDSTFEIQEQSQPTNQPNRSPFGRWETKLADEASSPKRLRRLVSADASRRTLTTCCLCNKKVQKVLHIHSNQWLVFKKITPLN